MLVGWGASVFRKTDLQVLGAPWGPWVGFRAPSTGPAHCDYVTSISGARLPWAPSPQVNLVSSDQVRGQQDLGGLGM